MIRMLTDLPDFILGPVTVRTLSLQKYLAERGLGEPWISESGLHRSSHHVSGAAKRRDLARLAVRNCEHARKRAEASADYLRLVREGLIQAPTRDDRLEAIAAGHPDNPSVQARQARPGQAQGWQMILLEPHVKWKAHRPRRGDLVHYDGKPQGTVLRVEDGLCWLAYLDGRDPLPFIWCFRDTLNTLHDWPSKDNPRSVP